MGNGSIQRPGGSDRRGHLSRGRHFALRTIGVACLAALLVAGCGSDDSSDARQTPPAGTTAAGRAMTITDAWVKTAAEGMSAAFGELHNAGAAPMTVVSVTSPASPTMELHETVANESGEMVMRPKEGGFVVPAGGTLTLEPGGNHFMLMDVISPIRAGDEVDFTVTFGDDSTLTFTAPAKDYSGANENYEGGMDMGDTASGTPAPAMATPEP
ncbi:copper chaperone PCu(A)C [Parafrankia sp. FMc6]|uniref:copper chaperone PCu(A)C n=1 Tax=Parafrankia soli TaxID=2599596 RepID=UPI0034D41A7D